MGEVIFIKNWWAFQSKFFSNKWKYVLLTPWNFIEEWGFKLRGENDRFYTWNFPESYLLNKDDIIIAMTEQAQGLLWSSALIPESWKYLLNQRLWLLQFDKNIIDTYFIYTVFNQFKTRKYITETSVWTKVKHTSPEKIYKFNLSLPSLPEQQKIAMFLSSIDEKIESLRTKKELLEKYKKWVMQGIFSRKIRFRDERGEEFGEWEERKLGEICEKQSSNISANSLDNNNWKYKIYWATWFLKCIDFYQEENDYISIVKDWAWVWRVLYCEWKSSVLWTLDKIKPKKWTNLYFLLFVLRNINFTKYTIWSTIPHIYFRDYWKEKLFFPSLPEQQKIADFLSGLDDKIEKFGQELESAERWKKGLLQEMFV